MGIQILSDKCTGCGLCIKSCPFGVIKVISREEAGKPHTKYKKIAVIEPGCNLCGACAEACEKFGAILIEKEESQTKIDISQYKGVWIFAEQKKGKVQGVVYELLNKGRNLADDLGGEKLSCVLLGEKVENEAKELILHGADKVYLVEDPVLKEFQDDPYTDVLTSLIKEEKPEIILMGATAIGRSFASRVAAKIGTGLTADCTELSIDKNERILLQTRPAFGGNIMATIRTINHRPQMATVRHKVFKKAQKRDKKGEIVRKKADSKNLKSRTKLLNIVEDITQKVNLADADIIVSGGRGLGKSENFKIIEELANVLGGAVGASRAAVDAGWIPYSHQVGQTGRTVCPKLYITCGISGQIQHLVGMQSSDTIVAINKDSNAPIFKVATYGIEGDLFEVVPALTKKFKEVLG